MEQCDIRDRQDESVTVQGQGFVRGPMDAMIRALGGRERALQLLGPQLLHHLPATAFEHEIGWAR